MKIFIVGSTGRVGKSLLKTLSTSEHQIFAGARRTVDLPTFENVTPVAFDLDWTPEQMAEKLTAMDVVINVAGSSGGSLLQVDLFGAVKLMQAAELLGVERFILLSTIFALQPEKWTTPGFLALKDYYIAKHFADLYLVKNTNLAYTILQPGALTEEKATGQIEVNDDRSGSNTIDDVAETLKMLISAENTIGKVITMHNGEQPIAQAIAQI
ncbi:SDR family oxidoreductase [Lactococcus kimchii]|uniref:SDR family oxidoreductase n=1 Tax=Lactococcus sp. S-13 TaxID=2507158 RepID=UPI00102363A1|nr:SDR family oxidoreductase [Lactococcus sp. S-13]RZI48278.1 SDR family oxidoreductase [Lactococcus sp. S-13]